MQTRAEQGVITDSEIFEAHVGGKLSVGLTTPLDTQRSLSIAYTPGVAQVSRAISADHTLAARYTWASRLVAVVSDGSAVLGLGDIGPAASLPVMEGKCGLFKEFAGLDAIPIVLDTKDPDEIVETLVRLRPTFGAVNLEDISAPRCFEIERRVTEALDCPVMHDDQHGTAIVVLSALMGASKLLGRDMTSLKMVVSGAGAAGVACSNLLLTMGVSDITVLDSRGILHTGRDDMNSVKAELARRSNPRGLAGGIVEALDGADVFLGLSAGVVPEELIATMAPNGIVFALSNPDPEIHPHVAAKYAAVVATGRSDYPEPDQQRIGVPRGIPRGAGGRGAPDHRKNDGRRGRGDLLRRQRRPRSRPDRPEPAGSARRRSGGQSGGPGRRSLRYRGVKIGRLAALLLAALLAVAGCATDTKEHPARPEMVVGSRPDSESMLLADIYVAALRSYGFGARAETAVDPMAQLDSGAFTVVPAFTGHMLQLLQPGSVAMSDRQVYRAMIAALPEGILAGDYTTAAEDKPALLVTGSTAKAWAGTDSSADLSALPKHCAGLVLGTIAGYRAPSTIGTCRLPAPREFPDEATLFAAVRDGHLTAGWTTTADPGIPADLVALADGKPALIRAENVVPLYRRNALSDRQLLAINEVAGVLDTAALAEMRRQVAGGADPQAVASGWLAEHPLGR